MCLLTGNEVYPSSPARARFLPSFADEFQRERDYGLTRHQEYVSNCLIEARHGCFPVMGAAGVGNVTFARRLAAHVQSIGDRNVLQIC
jgi:type II secretory pathway predicted ATPase ExeA